MLGEENQPFTEPSQGSVNESTTNANNSSPQSTQPGNSTTGNDQPPPSASTNGGNDPGQQPDEDWTNQSVTNPQVVTDSTISGKSLLIFAKQILLAGVIIYAFSIIISLILIYNIPINGIPEEKELKTVIIQSKLNLIQDIWNYSKVAIVGIITSVIGFYFGSSKRQ